jgi:uncharacterized protein YjiS (DUF1127 family)
MRERSMHATIDKPHLLRRRKPYRRTSRLAALIAWIDLYLRHRRERRELRALDDQQLRDVGLSKYDVEWACRRWPWNHRAWD